MIFHYYKYKVVKDHPQRLKTKQIWRPKEAKSKSKSKSNSGDLRRNFTGTIHYHYEALEFILIIKHVDLPKVDLLTSQYSTQKSLKKTNIINLQNEAMLLVKTFLMHNSKTNIFSGKHFLQNASEE